MSASPFTLRTELRPGDIGHVVRQHGLVYAQERGWDHRFEAYVAGPLAEFAIRHDATRERMWLAEYGASIVGSIAIVSGAADSAQLRWFLVDPAHRGMGVGTRLLAEAIAFCRATGRRHVYLWTVSGLDVSARLYRRAGFALSEQVRSERWGAPVVEERYDLALDP